MTFDFRLNERRRNHDRRQSVVSPEQLEARLLLSTTSITSGSLPIVSNLATGSPLVLSRSVSATSSADSADEFTITGTSASLSIQGVTSTTNVALTYAWTTTQAPGGGAISYSKNSTNQAKDNILTFTRAGAYVTRVLILSGKTVVSTLMLQLSVTQVPTKIGGSRWIKQNSELGSRPFGYYNSAKTLGDCDRPVQPAFTNSAGNYLDRSDSPRWWISDTNGHRQ